MSHLSYSIEPLSLKERFNTAENFSRQNLYQSVQLITMPDQAQFIRTPKLRQRSYHFTTFYGTFDQQGYNIRK